MTTADGKHTISFKGLGDVVGAIVIDGKVNEMPPGFIRDSWAVSADGKRLAYMVKKEGNKWAAVIDGVEGKSYDAYEPIVSQKPVFSSDGKRVAYFAEVDSGNSTQGHNEQFIVLDGKEGKHYGNVWPFVMFSPDSKHVLYVASTQSVKPGTGEMLSLVIDGVEEKAYMGNGYVTPQQDFTFSPDGQKLAYYVWDGKQSRMVVVNGVEGKSYDAINGPLVFSPDSKHLAYFARRNGKLFIVVDGVEGKEFDDAQRADDAPALYFSPDSNRIAYRAKQGDKYCAVIDGVDGKLYDQVSQAIYFSPDSKHISYSAKNGDKNLNILDGVETKGYYSSGQPAFSPDGKHFAYWARPSIDYTNYLVVVDGVEGKEYKSPAADPVFSPDGKHLVFVALGDTPYDEVIVADDVEYHTQLLRVMDPRLGIYFKPLQFESPTRFSYEAMKPNQQFVKVTVDILDASQ